MQRPRVPLHFHGLLPRAVLGQRLHSALSRMTDSPGDENHQHMPVSAPCVEDDLFDLDCVVRGGWAEWPSPSVPYSRNPGVELVTRDPEALSQGLLVL